MTDSIPITFSISEIRVLQNFYGGDTSGSTTDDIKLTTDVEIALDSIKSFLEITVSFEAVDPLSKQKLAFLKVLNTFSLEQMEKQPSKGKISDYNSLPSKVIDHFLLMASCHTRGIFSHLFKWYFLSELDGTESPKQRPFPLIV